jgi:Tfp pilus assembly protein PilO
MNIKVFLPFIIIGLSVGMYFMYISPTWTEIDVLKAKKAEYVTALEQSKEITAKRESLFNVYDNISKEDIAKLHIIIPDKYNAVLLANDLTALAAKDSVSIKDFKTNDMADTTSTQRGIGAVAAVTAPASLYKTHVVTIGVTGDFQQFIQFVSDLETSLRLLDVTSLGITSNGSAVSAPGAPKSSALQYTISLQTYSLQ